MVSVELSIDDRRKLQTLLDALNLFGEKDRDMPLQMIRTLLLVALNPGMNGRALAKQAGDDTTHTVMSRHLKDWGEINRYRTEGYNLIELHMDKYDHRFKRPEFTHRGRTFVTTLLAVLRGK